MTAAIRTRPSRLASTVRGIAGWRRFRDVRIYCMFIGYPRSGHSLLGALLDAHPRVVISHELDSLDLIGAGYGRLALFEAIIAHDAEFTRSGREWYGYDYRVPGEWQGRYDVLEVIGDKKGGGSTLLLAEHPDLLAGLRQVVKVPLRLIHHVRNPYDNVATIARRTSWTLDAALDHYLRLCSTVSSVLAGCDPTEVIEIRHEQLVQSLRPELGRVCEFLGVSPSPSYLDACASVVFPDARRTRDEAEWTPAAVDRVNAAIATYPFLSGYQR
jgi:Sulfotransferase family